MKWDARTWAWLLIGGPIAVFSLWAMFDNPRLYFVTLLNGLTLQVGLGMDGWID